MIAALVISYASSLRAWAEQRGQIADLRAEEAQRSGRVAQLEKELDRWNDPAYVEAQARERFGWVMPGETGYVVVGGTGKSEPLPGGSTGAAGPTDEHPAQRAWWSSLWGSVEEANKPPKSTSPSKRPKPAATIDPEATPSPGENR